MHAGESTSLECPSYYAHGGSEKNTPYGKTGSIPADSDLSYELDVLNCEGDLEDLNAKNKEEGNGAAPVVKLTDEERRERIEGSGPSIIDDKDRDNSSVNGTATEDGNDSPKNLA